MGNRRSSQKFTLNLNLNRNHILNKASHDFNEECGEDCIIFVANKIKAKIKVDIVNQNVETPAFESKDKCRHGCTIVVRLGLSTKEEWKIGTAFHEGPCRMQNSGCIIN